ncbi:MAG: ABC transporter ATP-binding protein [Desulfotignum sp.]|nr:ABC transporter ATP-binding protein [Desulfotignum sp.]
MPPAIKIQNLSKQYRLGVVGTGTLSNDLKRWWYRVRGKEDPFLKIGETNDRGSKSESEYVWALKDINLEVNQGEVLGIIGKNGAGKSTLLKILSRVTGPTTGRIDYNGRIGSLLEVGTGFHLELTGRENIFLNGAILGMTKAEIRSKLDEIIDFSGCERYIDTPVKRYSSGMTVRLGFAVAAHLEPEILVVDEVLAVGDAEFQKKAVGKMQDVSRKEGKTVLFVSHNMASVKNLCTKGVLLENGCLKMIDAVDNVIDAYLKVQTEKVSIYCPADNTVKRIEARQVRNRIQMSLTYESPLPVKQPSFGFVIYDNYDNPITGTNPLQSGVVDFGPPRKKGRVDVTLSSPFLANGSYPVSVWFHDGNAFGSHLFKMEKCLYLKVDEMNLSQTSVNPAAVGHIIPECSWSFTGLLPENKHESDNL